MTVTPGAVSNESLVTIVDRAASESGFSGVVGVDRPGCAPLREAYGMADRRWSIAMTPTTRLAIASGTKAFTALVIMSLIEQRTLALDQPVRSVLGGDLPQIDDDVTIQHLLTHTSGIGDYLDEELQDDISNHVMPEAVHRYVDAESYLATLDGHSQVTPPGTLFTYNNEGFVVLALLAQRASGIPYEQLVLDRVCRPAGLESTTFTRNDTPTPGLATGYIEADGYRTNSLHLPLLGVGDGGLASTLDDIAQFWRALFDARIVSSASATLMTTPHVAAPDHEARYGLGFWLHESAPAIRLEGYDAGISFRSWHDPDADITHTVIGNWSDAAWPVTRALAQVLGPS